MKIYQLVSNYYSGDEMRMQRGGPIYYSKAEAGEAFDRMSEAYPNADWDIDEFEDGTVTLTGDERARISECVTVANAKAYRATTDKLVFCADLLGATLTTDRGEVLAETLEDRLADLANLIERG